MIAVLRSEWIKLRTVRMNYVLVIIAIAFPLIISVLTVSLSKVREVNSEDLVGLITGTSVVTAMLLGVVAAVSIGGEFAHGTIRVTFAATPARGRVLIAKGIVTTLVSMVVEAVVVVLCYTICSAIANGRGASVSLSDSSGAKPAMVGVIVFAGIVSLLGYGLGMVIRNMATAVAVLILWPLLLENLIAGLLSVAGVDQPIKWLPYASGIVMADPEVFGREVSRVGGGLYFGAVALVITLVGAFSTSRRDA